MVRYFYAVLAYSKREKRNADRIIVWRFSGKRLLARLRNSWESDIKIDLREVTSKDRSWMGLAQGRSKRHDLLLEVLQLWGTATREEN